MFTDLKKMKVRSEEIKHDISTFQHVSKGLAEGEPPY